MKTLQVRVIPNAKRNMVLEEEGRLKVYLTVPPAEGRANKALIELLADHFQVKKSSIRIVKGERARDKVVQIEL
jgi:uncharacterized protein (TIGR00251 family)